MGRERRQTMDAAALRDESAQVAAWVRDFLAPAYGPGGGAKAIVGADLVTTYSGASALREAPDAHPGLAPYRELALRVQAAVGDQASMAALLAAGLVHRLLATGLPSAAILDGLALARRQALACLDAQTRPATPQVLLASVAPGRADWPDAVVAGLQAAHRAGLTRLDDVDIVVRAAPLVWAPGLHLDAQGERPVGPVRVLLLEGPPRSIKAVSRDPDATRRHETAQQRQWAQALTEAGDVLVFRRSVGDRKEALATRCMVVDDCPAGLWRRLQVVTGAVPGADLRDAVAGRGTLRRNGPRQGGWTLSGGPAATMFVPPGVRAAADEAERFLRAAGIAMAHPVGVPGAGVWQRTIAQNLRVAADAAPGTTPIALRAAAKAFDDLADALLRNLGHDPTRPPRMPEVLDIHDGVRAGVDAAFEAATALLRIDGRHAKRPSDRVGLRGSRAKAGSPKGMPGDIPPLM